MIFKKTFDMHTVLTAVFQVKPLILSSTYSDEAGRWGCPHGTSNALTLTAIRRGFEAKVFMSQMPFLSSGVKALKA